MAALSSWYSNQYGVWRRTRRLQMPPFLAAAENTRTPPPDAVIINMGDLAAEKKKQETLFGPAIGPVNAGPDWAVSKPASTAAPADDLTPEIVTDWIAKSKDQAQPTTTLQALVNLKRPTLKLSPLMDDPQHHALEFQYDCDAPKCAIRIEVLPHSQAAAATLVYEHRGDGGFGKALALEDEATLELAKFEAKAAEEAAAEAAGTSKLTAARSRDDASTPEPVAQQKKRFSAFPFRKRAATGGSAAVPAVTAGPALQVVDVETDGAAAKKDDGGGVRVAIHLEALDEDERPLQSVNTQVTYLHVVRLGAKADEKDKEDSRAWVVKVVKREATIGPHTFHLHEIYGLTATAAPTAAPTYPPTTDATDAQAQAYDFAGQECVLCLSSAREVVLLPCRHLVACKECAVNMVEFGAGGTLQHATDAPAAAADTPAPAAEGDAAVAPAEGEAPPTPTAATAPTAAAPRRKRKPKGWFCPVCRQPYTSLLRITTTPPDLKAPRDSEDEPAVPEPALVAQERPGFLRSISRALGGGGGGGGAHAAEAPSAAASV